MSRLLLALATAFACVSQSPAQQLPKEWVEQLNWRSIGPAAMGGRIVALAVYEKEPSTWWAATASGGLLKTTNNGMTFEHQFDKEAVVSIGDVVVSQTDKNILWVGSGEAQPRNSVSFGNGVYKSSDGGKTWKHMGLNGSFQIGRIAIHHSNPDIVYVGALGRLYGKNEERGLYKTTDGGTTWTRSLFVDDQTGIIDIDMHPTDADTLMVAAYERARDGFDGNDPAKRWGPGGGIWKTTDGGANWQRIGKGLPSCQIGRVGIDYYRKDPRVLMAIVESEKIAKQPEDAPFLGAQVEAADAGVKITSVDAPRTRARGGRGGEAPASEKDAEKTTDTPAKKAGLQKDDVILAVAGKRVNTQEELERQCRQHKAGDAVGFTVVRDRKDTEIVVKFGNYPENANSPFVGTLGGQAEGPPDLQGPNGHEYGGVYKSTDGGDSWVRINTLNPRPMYYSQIRIDPSNSDNVMVCGTALARSTDGGKSFQGNAGNGMHVDHHAEWIDPNDGNHILHGCDGGIYVTYDACKNWDHLNHVAIGQFYHVGVSADRNYYVYGGLQDNGSWGGPSRTSGQGARNEDWIRVGGGDGFRCLVDPDDKNVVYSQSQNGPPSWRNLETSQGGSMRPGAGGRGGQAGQAGQGGGERESYRFNWETPYILSGHNSKIVYTAGNKVWKSLNRGAGMQAISPGITNTDKGSATALAESPVDADIVYVGTDDGALWVTRDGADNWINCFAETAGDPTVPESQPENSVPTENRVPTENSVIVERGPSARAVTTDGAAQPIAKLVPGPRWVSELVASHHQAKRAYVTLDGHRSDDDAPYVMVTEDAGATWRSLAAGLPDFAGSTRTISEDPKNENVLYLGTEFHAYVSLDRGEHWTRMNGKLPTVAVHGFAIHLPSGEMVVATHGRSLWVTDVNEIRQMTKDVMAKNVHFYEPLSAVVWKGGRSTGGTNRSFSAENPPDGARLVYHIKKNATAAKIEIFDGSGEPVSTLQGKTEAGLHTVQWNLRRAAAPSTDPRANDPRFAQFFRNRGGRRVDLGTYTVRLTVDGEVQSHNLKVEIDPEHPDPIWIQAEDEAALLEFLLSGDEDDNDR